MTRRTAPFLDWPATARYRLSGAPGELGLVQDLLNTIQEGSTAPPDLLATLASAQEWADAVVELWSSVDPSGWAGDLPPLTDHDRRSLLSLRARLFAGLYDPTSGGEHEGSSEQLRLSVSGGHVDIRPAGAGWQHFATALLLICYRAQLTGELRRLKTCKSHECDVVFYDRSPNNSAVWHDVKVCGNRANVRAHRARTRTEATHGRHEEERPQP
jgi:hypothetical protein